jgi:hypothetical protein
MFRVSSCRELWQNRCHLKGRLSSGSTVNAQRNPITLCIKSVGRRHFRIEFVQNSLNCRKARSEGPAQAVLRAACRAASLMRFQEGGDGILPALGADFQVVPVVGEGLVAPLASFDSRGLHLRDFFEQQFFEVFDQVSYSPFFRGLTRFASANEASMYYKLRHVKRINKVYMKAM